MARFSWTLENRRTLPAKIATILVPVDFSAASSAAMHHAVEVARAHQAAIDVVHVWDVPNYTGAAMVAAAREPEAPDTSATEEGDGDASGDALGPSPTFAQYMQERATRELEAFLSQWTAEPLDIRGRVLDGEPGPVIAALTRDESFDLCVIGEHDRGVREVILGSVCDRVLRDAACPVVTVRAREDGASPPDVDEARST
jgi:nucleotide-binding universal stress UspA family protein